MAIGSGFSGEGRRAFDGHHHGLDLHPHTLAVTASFLGVTASVLCVTASVLGVTASLLQPPILADSFAPRTGLSTSMMQATASFLGPTPGFSSAVALPFNPPPPALAPSV